MSGLHRRGDGVNRSARRLPSLLAALVADTVPADVRGTSFGVFHLASGVALLLASLVAGTLWTLLGAPPTFLAGAIAAAGGLLGGAFALARGRRRMNRTGGAAA
jgi:MFS family permease